MSKHYNLTLCMIVKNESKNIEETLVNIVDNFNIDYWVISDTGSTDNTIDIITKTFQKLSIPGRFHNKDWKDFSTNRNYVIEEAENISNYLLFFDADDKVHGNFNLPELKEDCYMLKFGPSFIWHRIFIVKTNNKWRYKGILHEYITCDNPSFSRMTITGSYYIVPGTHGCRSKDPNKYFNDGLVFEKAIIEGNTSKELVARYTYYCAQSYKDARRMDRAIEFYKKTIELDGWVQEKYIACKVLGDYYKKQDLKKAISYYTKSRAFDPTRVDCIMELANMFSDEKLKLNILTSIPSHSVADPKSENYLFIDMLTHNVYYFNTVIILAYKMGEIKIVCDYLTEQLKRFKTLPEPHLKSALNNVNLCLSNHIHDGLLDLFSQANRILFSNTVNYPNTIGLHYLGREKLYDIVCKRTSLPFSAYSFNASKSLVVLFSANNASDFKNTFFSFIKCYEDHNYVEDYFVICDIKTRGNILKMFPELSFIKHAPSKENIAIHSYSYSIHLDCKYYFCHKEKYTNAFVSKLSNSESSKVLLSNKSSNNYFEVNHTRYPNKSISLSFNIISDYKNNNELIELDISNINLS